MTTQAEDLGKLLTEAIAAAVDTYTTNLRLSSLEICTAIGKLTNAIEPRPNVMNIYPQPGSTHQAGHTTPGQPDSATREETDSQPPQGPQNGTQPDWTDAILTQDLDGDHWGRYNQNHILLGDVGEPARIVLSTEQLEEGYGPLTVIIDRDGNTPATFTTEKTTRVDDEHVGEILTEVETNRLKETIADLAKQCNHQEQELAELKAEREPEWLDADELRNLPQGSVVKPRYVKRSHTYSKTHDGEFVACGYPSPTTYPAHAIAPARLIYIPEADRAANPAAVRELINRAEHRLQELEDEDEPEWLDAEALGRLPQYAIVLPRDRTLPRGKAEDGRWWVAGHDHGFPSSEIAPARVLHAPGA